MLSNLLGQTTKKYQNTALHARTGSTNLRLRDWTYCSHTPSALWQQNHVSLHDSPPKVRISGLFFLRGIHRWPVQVPLTKGQSCGKRFNHDDVIKWKHFSRNWPFVGVIHRSRWTPHTKASDAELWCFLYLRLNKRLRKQPLDWWFETPSWPLWRHCNVSRRHHGFSLRTFFIIILLYITYTV